MKSDCNTEVRFYGGPLHGQSRAVRANPPEVWISAEQDDDGAKVTVEYEQAAPWWINDVDRSFAAVYVCRSWIHADGQMKSRDGYSY